MKFKDQNDTITALATPSGTGAIAVIRISGIKSIEIASSVFKGKNLNKCKSHTIHLGKVVDNGNEIDEVLVSIFRAPKSYTGEDIIEISCHGSVFIQQKIIELLVKNGSRYADPGEFTLRAFLNGKFDLAQAEAVADLIASDAGASHEMAIKQMRGLFSFKINELKEKLINFASLIELELDFSEEDVQFANRSELIALLNEIRTVIQNLLNSFQLGNVIKNGVPVVIIGKPNVGKSTLLNALLNDERAIVSAIAGTTRDFIEDFVNLGGIKFRFIDTAGLRDTKDEIEKIGIERTKENIEKAEIVLYLFDASEINPDEIKKEIQVLKLTNKKLILIGNKVDKVKNQKVLSSFKDTLFVSAKQKIGIQEIEKKLIDFFNDSGLKKAKAVVTNLRHFDALNKSNESLNKVLNGLNNNLQSDLLSIDIKHSINHLSEITGTISSDELLGAIFSRFCIGK